MKSSFILSQAAVYRLQQLANQVRQETGVRHKLSDPKSVISLLRYSSTCSTRMIRTRFAAFTDELEEEHRQYLASRGLLLPPVSHYSGDIEKLPQISFG